jgi:hypothetical protein
MQDMLGLQDFDNETRRIADPNDFKYGMGQRRLAFLFVIDAVCIGNINSKSDAQIPTETRQEVVDTLGPHLPAFIDRLATPCNCDRVRDQHSCRTIGACLLFAFALGVLHASHLCPAPHYIVAVLQIQKLLEGWLTRTKAPLFPVPKVKDAIHRLKPSIQKRNEKMATRIAATYVQTGQGTGANSYLPLNIPCMYGSFMPKLPCDAPSRVSETDLVRLRFLLT